MNMDNPIVMLLVFGIGGVLGEKLYSWIQVAHPWLLFK